MKKLIPLSLLLIVLSNCQQSSDHEGVFELLPSPREYSISGNSSLNPDQQIQYYTSVEGPFPLLDRGYVRANDSEEAQLHFEIDDTMEIGEEGYELSINGERIVIRAKDRAGLGYSFVTLTQLAEDAREQGLPFPACEITDFPLLKYRAIHLDMKHHREKKEYYYAILDKLAHYKINAIIAEVEDKLGYQRQPLVGSDDALSIEEFRELSEYAKARNIEISPLVQGLGHASFVLKHEEYKALRDDPVSDWAFNPLDPKTYEVQFDLYRDAMEAMPYGRYLHVGGDEVHTTGRGSGKSALELQLIWLNKVSEFAAENNRIPIFWDDMPLKHAEVYRPMFQPELTEQAVDSIWERNGHGLEEFLDQFPKNCVYMRWNYSHPYTYGNTKAMNWFREKGMKVMGATAGQQRWVLMPQNGGNLENIRTFSLKSIESDLGGLLLTLWDDDSPHFELYWRGILAFSEFTWAGDTKTVNDLKIAYRHREFGKKFRGEDYSFIDDLEAPVGFWKNALLEGNNRNNISRLTNPLKDAAIALPDPTNPGKWTTQYKDRIADAETHLQTLVELSEKLDSLKGLANRNSYSLQVYEQVCSISQFSPKLLLALRDLDANGSPNSLKVVTELMEEFSTMRQELETVYSKTRILSKPDGYILDQDHHAHLANQSLNFDWQFSAEMLLLEKIQSELVEKTLY